MLFETFEPRRIVERVHLVRRHELRLCRNLRIEEAELLDNRGEVVHRIASRCARHVDDVDQHLCPLDVAQKLIAKAGTRMRALDQARHIRDHEAAIVAQRHDAEVRRQRGERIIGDLRSRGRDARDERRFAGVREAHESGVGEQLQL